LGERVEEVVPKSVTVLETTVLAPVEQEISRILAVNLDQWGGSKGGVAEAGSQYVGVGIHLRNTLAVERDGDKRCRAAPREDARHRIGIVDEVTVMGPLELEKRQYPSEMESE